MMELEQAFFTRDFEKGLGVYASSNEDEIFLKKCELEATLFKNDMTEQNSQFVFYSKEFQCYIGAMLTMGTYENGEGNNKVIHFFVPKKKSDNPSDFILDYPFLPSFDREKKYSGITCDTLFVDEDISRIAEKYNLKAYRLSYLLYKLFQALFSGRQLFVVVGKQYTLQDSLSMVVKEIHWLLSKMIYASGNRCLLKEMSYCLYANTNAKVAKVVYTEEDAGGRNCFYLDGSYEAENIPDVFHLFATNLEKSYEAYEEVWERLCSSIFLCDLQKTWDEEDLYMAFLDWCMDESIVLSKQDLPMSMEKICRKCRGSKKTHSFMYRFIKWCKKLDGDDGKMIWKYFVTYLLEEEMVSDEAEDFSFFYASLMNLTFYKQNDICVKMYENIASNGMLRNRILSKLFSMEDAFAKTDTEVFQLLRVNEESMAWYLEPKKEKICKIDKLIEDKQILLKQIGDEIKSLEMEKEVILSEMEQINTKIDFEAEKKVMQQKAIQKPKWLDAKEYL